uniref:Uncharacterized protein n=1 Tax=Vitrella brassicaformis TaxID=1169539 RepID=A0A7S1K5C9_9ALVE|mmetsp:Transcript_36765/g.92102  ORF Transcript_36765/g.92102 Transcript_36765/m.92102 type:complete len:123 (+) Transcript_36765:70-438(+)
MCVRTYAGVYDERNSSHAARQTEDRQTDICTGERDTLNERKGTKGETYTDIESDTAGNSLLHVMYEAPSVLPASQSGICRCVWVQYPHLTSYWVYELSKAYSTRTLPHATPGQKGSSRAPDT